MCAHLEVQTSTRSTTLSQPSSDCASAPRGLRALVHCESWTSRSCDHKGQLRRSPLSNLSDIGGLWVNISHSLRTTAETVLSFERPPQRNQWYDGECREPTGTKNTTYKKTLQSAATRAIVENYREKGKETPFQTQEEGTGKT